MRYRTGFVSNSSSASFVIGIPSTDKKGVLHTLFTQFEHEFFGKYYIREAIQDNLKYAEERYEDCKKEYDQMVVIPIETRVDPKNPKHDPLTWKESSMKQWENTVKREQELLKDLEDIAEKAEEDLVLFGLGYYGICFSPTYPKGESPEEIEAEDPHFVAHYDADATDDSDLKIGPIQPEQKIIGYQLSDWVTMFNDYGDMPRKLRSMAGVLMFVYPDLKCWVEEDD